MSDLNPYPSNSKEYCRFRHSYLDKMKDYDTSIQYSLCEDKCERKKILNIPYVRKKTIPIQMNPDIIDNTPKTYMKSEYDPDGILNENDFYIFYKDKVWSKHRDRYLKVQTLTGNKTYVMLHNIETKKVAKFNLF